MDTNRSLDIYMEEIAALKPLAEGKSPEDRAALHEQAKAKTRERVAAMEAAEAAETERWAVFDPLNVAYLAAADCVDAAIQDLGAAVRDALAACLAAAQAYPGKSLPPPYQEQNFATIILEVMARGIPKAIQIPAADPGASVGELVRAKASEIANARGLAVAKAASAADTTTADASA